MAIETRVAQKDKLYTLLSIKKEYENAGIVVLPGLQKAINHVSATMEAEDVSYVEKQIATEK